MKKDNILFGIVGLLFGCIIGFLFANNLNQTEAQTTTAAPPPISAAVNPAQNQNLPPDHPQIGGAASASQTAGGAPVPEVAAAIKKADAQPTDFDAQLNAGDVYYEIQRFADAAKYYERATKIRPDSLETLVKTGNAFFDAENYTTAEKWYSAALAKNPDDANVRTDLGLSFYLRNPPDVERAIKEYKMSLEKSPNHELSLQNLVVALRDKSDTNGTQEAMSRLAKINPNNPVLTSDK